MASLNQQSCPYSNGNCFVAERRTWGFVTEVAAGCQQAQACSMQKYQNFLIQSARQCWPGDKSDVQTKVPQRSNDVLADNWLYNIVQGGLTGSGSSGASFQFSDVSDFDATFFDDTGLNNGLYRESEASFADDKVAVEYTNGLISNSKCHQVKLIFK